MIDDSCKVPRENLNDGFNPCRKQVVENGELCQYAHMYDVMSERYDREDETSYLDWAKRGRITQSTPSQTVGEGKLYSQDAQGVEGFVKSSGTLDPAADAEIPSSKAVADYIRPEIAAAFENRIADAVADNGLLPTNALMMDYVDAHYMDTPPDKFYYAVSPFPSGAWEGEMTVNVTPVLSVKVGTHTYVIARVYGYKKFNYTGTADSIDLFTGLKPVGDYTGVFRDSTRIPLTFDVIGRSSAISTYGLTPKGSAANLCLTAKQCLLRLIWEISTYHLA